VTAPARMASPSIQRAETAAACRTVPEAASAVQEAAANSVLLGAVASTHHARAAVRRSRA
jgi:hypothetical protein